MTLPTSLDFLTRDTAFALLCAALLIVGVLWMGSVGGKKTEPVAERSATDGDAQKA